MSKIPKREKISLKFDTSSANIGCFIRGKSKQKMSQHDRYSSGFKGKRKSRYERQKKMQFQDKAFLQSVVCKILNDADCQGITQLIDNMVFPGSTTTQLESHKDVNYQYFQQQQISQIFRSFQPQALNHPHSIYAQTAELYRIISPLQLGSTQEKQQCKSTFQSSMFNSLIHSPRSADDSNPEVMSSINHTIPAGYSYSYYPQGAYLYQRPFSQRKKKNPSGQQANQYKIVPEKIQADGRTTLMIRHIPNKYSEDMLFQEIGRNHKMKINFLYLPIDHYNTCNVGYAFVNFIHSKFICDFYKEFNGRRWDRFNSQKICELAYARIQGTTNLMDHFQNSAGSQLRGRTVSKCQDKKGKLVPQPDDPSFKNISKLLDFQKVEEN